MRNETEGEERRRVVRHLLAGCARCVVVTRRFWSLAEGAEGTAGATGGLAALPGDPHPASYGGIFERLVDGGFQREREVRADRRSCSICRARRVWRASMPTGGSRPPPSVSS